MSASVSDHHAAWLAVMVEHGWVVEYDDDGHIKSLTSPMEGVAPVDGNE